MRGAPHSRRRDWWVAWLLCLAPRLAALFAFWPDVTLDTSSGLIENGWLFTDIATPLWPPAYLALAEVLWRLTGGHLLAYAVAHVAIASLVGVFVLSVCRSLSLSTRAGWLAVLAVALLPYYVSTSVRQLDVGIVITVCAAFAAVMARWRATAGSAPLMIRAAALTAMLLFLTRANALSLIVALYAVLLVAPGRVRRQHVVTSAGIFVVLMSVWSATNAARFGAFTPFPANTGVNLWLGNHAGAGAELMARDFNPSNTLPVDVPADATLDGGDAYASDRAVSRLAWGYLLAHPAETVSNMGRKFVRYFDWRLDEQSPHGRVEQWAYTAPYLLMLICGAIGVGALWRTNRWALLWLGTVVIGYLLPHLLAFGMIRFRMSVEWATLILAAVGVDVLARAASPAYPLQRND